MKTNAFVAAMLLGALWTAPGAMAGDSDGASKTRTNWSKRLDVSAEEVRRGFGQPDMIYAPFAFWFWDRALDPEHAARMAKAMCLQGMNPGYAHPRRGLPRDEWLSPLWFESFNAALEASEVGGAYLGYCDEYWWPSGRADGRVLRKHPELKAISLSCRTFDVAEGESTVLPESFFTVAAQHAGPFVKPPQVPALGKWIWNRAAEGERRSAYFRRQVHVSPSASIVSATMTITADNSFVLHVNGKKTGENPTWTELSDYDLAPVLRGGKNVIAVESRNEDGPCGLIFGLRIDCADGTLIEVGSDKGCRSSSKPEESWTGIDFDDAGWAESIEYGDSGIAPWYVTRSIDVHTPALIKSNTLRLIENSRSGTFRADEGSWRVYSFTKYHHPGVDGGDVNYIDRRLPKAFIEIAHVPYDRHFEKRMGRSIPGVFVDNEGDYGYKIAWSDDLDQEYEKTKGRDIRLWMPLLLDRDEEGLFAKARWDWYDVVSDIYADSFLGSVSRWLEERGAYCISNLWEESLAAQAFAVGDFFKAQRAVSMPGNDCLVHKALEVHDFKEIQSVTEFEGCRFQSEILGVAGWQMSPVLMKKAVNAVIAWGVSHIVPHGVNLNRELNTIPYPPDWFESNPYWPALHLWTDFARRASYVNSQGHLVPDVLLLNPMDSTWALLGGKVFDANHPVSFGSLFNSEVETGESGTTVKEIESVYAQAIKDLTAARIEYLIADRHYMRRMEVSGDGRLVTGPFAFKAVVLPDLLILPLDVARKIVAFAEAGGCVYLLGNLPGGSTDHGMDDPEMRALMKRLEAFPTVRAAGQGVPGLVSERAPFMEPRVQFEAGEFPVLGLHRRVDGHDFFWLANNTGEQRKCSLVFRDARGAASIWNCENGSISRAPSRDGATGSSLDLTFEPYEAFWVVFDPDEAPIKTAKTMPESGTILLSITGPWKVRIDPSVQPVPVASDLKAPDDLLSEKGDERPLASWLDWALGEFTGYVDYMIDFELNDGHDSKRLVLDLGEVKHVAEVWINGSSKGSRLWPPFEFDITEAACTGKNEIKVRVGNLLCNAMKPYKTWGWTRPGPDDFDAGLLGPVVIRTVQSQ